MIWCQGPGTPHFENLSAAPLHFFVSFSPEGGIIRLVKIGAAVVPAACGEALEPRDRDKRCSRECSDGT